MTEKRARRPPTSPCATGSSPSSTGTSSSRPGPGPGKTYSLAMRMAAGIAAGRYTVEHMAAVTFTRKAAAELRGRFQLALEERLRANAARRRERAAARSRALRHRAPLRRHHPRVLRAPAPRAARRRPHRAGLRRARRRGERCGCGSSLARLRRARRGPAGFAPLLELLEAGIKPKDLDGAFATVCEHEDVAFDTGTGDPPALRRRAEGGRAVLEGAWQAEAGRVPGGHEVQGPAEVRRVRRPARGPCSARRSIAQLGSLLTFWNGTELTQKWWGDEGRPRRRRTASRRSTLVEAFQADVVDPFIAQWRAYLHRLAMRVLDRGPRRVRARPPPPERRQLRGPAARDGDACCARAATCAARSSRSTAGCSSTSSRTPTPSRPRSS